MIAELYAEGTNIVVAKRIYPLIELTINEKGGLILVKLTKNNLDALAKQIKEASESWEQLQKEAYAK